MTTDETETARVIVEFHSSSTKDGREAYKIVVLEGAGAGEANRVFDLAASLRRRAREELAPKPLVEQLEESLHASG